MTEKSILKAFAAWQINLNISYILRWNRIIRLERVNMRHWEIKNANFLCPAREINKTGFMKFHLTQTKKLYLPKQSVM